MNIRYCSMNPAWVEPIKWDQNLALCRKTPHALDACSQSDTIYCTGCAQNCILLHSQRGRGDRYCRWCTHWGPTSLIVDCKTLRCIRCKRFKCKRRQCMELKHITCDSAGDVWGVCVTDRGGWFLWQGAFALDHPRSQDSAPLLIRP